MQETVKAYFEQVRTLLWPTKYLAWQSFLRLSLFSWLVATILAYLNGESYFPVDVLSTLSWMFLTSAIWWAIDENKDKFKAYGFYFGPWITGAVLCIFLFRPWEDNRARWAISCWPLISTAIMALPNFVNWELKVSAPKKDQQQSLVMTLLANLLLTSWILFFFRVQDWVANYPSLLVSELDKSAFVYDFVADRERESGARAQGIPLIESTANAIIGELNGQPWYQTERWLYTRQSRLEAIALRMVDNLEAPDERDFWRMAVPQPRRLGEGYLLTLRADWLGPVAGEQSFYVEKTCKITPEDRPRSAADTGSDDSSQDAASGGSAQQVTRVTAVDCGEDLPPIQWNGTRT
ncbi:MAG: DUF5357 family protein [Cyanobacteria bacterium P01_D01_bin.105]